LVADRKGFSFFQIWNNRKHVSRYTKYFRS